MNPIIVVVYIRSGLKTFKRGPSNVGKIPMPEILLFTKPECQKCDYVKDRMPGNLEISYVDTSTPEGLAEAAYYEILGKNVPILVVDDQVVEGAIAIMSRLKELANGQA
ncbi:MAG: hypothetical protein GX369_04355 [Euryarchaeota archaeon]|nr:hypothetical protein [Euryarchaeota archaeon]